MNKIEFMELMQFPREWLDWNMYTDEFFMIQINQYVPGSEEASEHYRNGAFHGWLHKRPKADVLKKLVELTYLDPDPLMGADVRSYIVKSDNCTDEIRKLLL